MSTVIKQIHTRKVLGDTDITAKVLRVIKFRSTSKIRPANTRYVVVVCKTVTTNKLKLEQIIREGEIPTLLLVYNNSRGILDVVWSSAEQGVE